MIGPVVSFWNVPGQSHVQMLGCDNLGAAAAVASLARTIRRPGL